MRNIVKSIVIKLIIIAIIAAIGFSITTCDDSGQQGVITINLGSSRSSRSAVWPPDEDVFDKLSYEITLIGNGETIEFNADEETIRATVNVGLWNVKVDAYYEDGDTDRFHYATGSAEVDVKVGRSNPVVVKMGRAGDDDDEPSSEGLIFELITVGLSTHIGKYSVKGAPEASGHVVIPGWKDDIQVIMITSMAFRNNTNITRVTIEEGVTNINEYAFQGCTNLTSVTIPATVTSIGQATFGGCTALTEVILSEGVTTIGDGTFNGCTSLASIIIHDSVTNIGQIAFGGCTALTEITIPASVTTIGGAVFRDSTKLATINVDTNNLSYTSENGVLYNKGKTQLIAAPPAGISGDFTIPDTVTNIGASAFQSCTGLTSVEIPSGVTTIGANAFSYCSRLTSITIPSGVTTINSGTFRGCTSLTSVTIPNVRTIDSEAFSSCTNLTDITLPGSLRTIGSNAFNSCRNLNIEIPSTVTSIGGSAFQYSGLTSVTIPEGITTLDGYMFYGCSRLKSIVIPASLTSLSSSAFNLTPIATVTFNGDNTAPAVLNSFPSGASLRTAYTANTGGAGTYTLSGGVWTKGQGTVYSLGDTGPGGGIIFYYDPAGFTVEGYGSSGDTGYFESYTAHYLEAAPAGWYGTDDDPQLMWAPNESDAYANVSGTDVTIGTGRKNTTLIILATAEVEPATNAPAAYACYDYTDGSYNDWFLPSFEELFKLREHYYEKGADGYGGLVGLSYWTSIQNYLTSSQATSFVFNTGNAGTSYKYQSFRVRPIRAF